MSDVLELTKLRTHNIANLSGGELQRFAIAVVCVQECDVYMFDEPVEFLYASDLWRGGGSLKTFNEI